MRLSGLMRGFVALVAVSALGLLLRLLLEIPYPPQELFNRLSQFMGTPAMFQMVHRFLGYGVAGKVFAFAGSFGLWLVILSLFGWLRPWLASVLVFLACVLLVPVTVALGTALVYFGLRYALESPQLGDSMRLDRRNALGWLTLGSGVLVGGGVTALLRYTFDSSSTPKTALKGGQNLPSGITAQSDFYSISKNLEAFDPKLNADKWQLKVSGLVKTPRQYTLAELKTKPRNDLEATMVCISNAVGGGLIGNAIWNGFRLRDLLLEVGIEPTARFINWKAADGYTESLPLAQALEDDVLLVYGMNNEALSQKHGFPLRVLIPGRLGMKQPRWITEIELSDKETTGYWVERGWSRSAYAQTMSRIDSPDELAVNLKASGIQEIRGIAFAGKKAITKVEISTDGGTSWQEAELLPRRSSLAWQQWRSPWMPKAGSHQLAVRAYADGVMQPEEERDALPEASSGWHHFITNLI
jgi:DMSO/TMAO reductase YedYZ molybdopterin-dependent catalytic subunit